MPNDVLTELKRLQYMRGESSPFASHIEFESWADRVIPLLSFDKKLQSRFSSMVLATKHARILKCAAQEIENINSAIGMVNQAVKSLEIMPIPNTAPKPSTKQTNNKDNWHIKPIGQIGIGVFVVILGAMAVYIFRNHIGIPL